MAVDLHYKQLGEGFPLIILHGMFGMLDNWLTLGKQFADRYAVYLIDQRNHGKSPHIDEMDYFAMADDILQFMDTHRLPQAHIIGHSMGGKTAMQFAAEHAERVARLAIVDIAPKIYPAGEHDDVFAGFAAVDLAHITNRAQAEAAMATQVHSITTLQFLLKNLTRLPDGSYVWKCNYDVIYRHYADILDNTLSPYTYCELPTLFLKGGNSRRYIELPQDIALLTQYFPNSEIVTVPDAGHWIHAEQPEAFFRIVSQFLSSEKIED